MATLQLKKIAESLARAQGVGQVEDGATIAGCYVVFRSLRPDEYEQVHADTSEREDLEYLNAYRKEHLARSIVEVAGVNFREVDLVEVEDPDGKPISIEKHEFVRDYIISTWSREAIDVAFRKFNDAVAKADRVSAEGVRFDIPDETPDEKYRRLISELREIEGELPMDLALRLLEEAGYTKRVTTQDFEVAQERLRNMAAANESKIEQAQAAPAKAPVPEIAPSSTSVNQPSVSQPGPKSSATSRPASAEDLMRMRKPIHGQPAVTAPSQNPPPMTRSQQIVATEDQFDGTSVQSRSQEADPESIPVLDRQAKLDPSAASAILDRPPVGGVNRRFRPPPGSM